MRFHGFLTLALGTASLALLACGSDNPDFVLSTATASSSGSGGSGQGGGATNTASSASAGGGGATIGTGGSGGTGAGGSGGAPTCPGALQDCVYDFAGSYTQGGSTDGFGAAARFHANGIAGITSTGGHLYVTDRHAIRRIEIATGEVTTFAGTQGGGNYVDGASNTARFNGPTGIATDGTTLWVADAGNNVIRTINISTGMVGTLTGQQGTAGNADGDSSTATFNGMRDLAWDGTNLFLIEGGNHLLRRITTSGDVVTLAGQANASGFNDGSGTTAQFATPRFIEAVGTAELYVSDTENNRPRYVTVDATPIGTVSSPYGGAQGFMNGTGTAGQFWRQRGIAFDGTDLVVSDSDNRCLRHINLANDAITTLAGQCSSGQADSHADGVGTAARFEKPMDIHYDADSGDLFIVEGSALRRMIYK